MQTQVRHQTLELGILLLQLLQLADLGRPQFAVLLIPVTKCLCRDPSLRNMPATETPIPCCTIAAAICNTEYRFFIR